MIQDKLVRTAWGHVFSNDSVAQGDKVYQSAMSVAADYQCKRTELIFAHSVVMCEEHDALTMVERQHEVVGGSENIRLELVVGDVQFFEWKLNVCECQLAEGRLTHSGKRDERGEFVAEHGCLELLRAIAQLLQDLVGLYK